MKKKFIFLIIMLTLVLSTFRIYKIINQYSSIQDLSTCSNNSLSKNDQLISRPKVNSTPNYLASSGNVIITIPEFIKNMQCKKHTLQSGETLTSIAKKYVSTCPIKCSVKLIKEASKITNADLISAGSTIYIPETILNNGYLYTPKYGDTWDKLCKDYYPIYNSDYITELLIFINDLHNTTLPVGTEIYLPEINI